MTGLPLNLSLLIRAPLIAGLPLSPPLFPSDLSCGPSYNQSILEPLEFSDDSTDWYGGIDQLGDPFTSTPESYLGTIVVGSQLGVEFSIPSDFASGSGIYTALRYVNSSAAQVTLYVEYFSSLDNVWHETTQFTIDLTGSYVFTYLNSVLETLPFTSDMVKFRVLIVVGSITSLPSLVGEVRLEHLTVPYCSLTIVSPPVPTSPPPPLDTPPQSPDTPGTLPPFFIIEPGLPPLPPPPVLVSPPLPLGSEILKPNRDILVRLWNPRPAYMQLNDPLDLDSPVNAVSPLYGPASVDIFDETNGNFLKTVRPRVEVGFTSPVNQGPWESLQLRFRAARSRPPQPEAWLPPLPEPLLKTPASRECPPDQFVYPRSTDFPGIWQIPPLETELSDSVDSPTNTCYMTAPVDVTPGLPAQIALTPVAIQWIEGWEQITVRLVARARSAKEDISARKIIGISGRVVQFDPFHAGLPAGGPSYQVRWNPFDCNNNIHAFKYSDTEIRGIGVIQTNLDIHADFFISTQDSDNVTTEVSTDGVSYYRSVIFDLAAFKSTVIYYRVVLNKGGLPSPAGNIAIGLGLRISGPYVMTGNDIATYPKESAPFIISVSQGVLSDIPLISQCRVGIILEGNMDLLEGLKQYTDNLTSSWTKYEISWRGFWSSDEIKDLRIQLSPEALYLLSDVPYIDISAMDVRLSPYCPGLSQPITVPLISLRQVDVLPVSDVLINNWEPTPCWITLVADPTLVAQDYVSTNARQGNQLVVKMGTPEGLFTPLPGFDRSWVKVELIIQARVNTFGSDKAYLSVSTNFGEEQDTPVLTSDSQLYQFSWDYAVGLTTDQINRLKVALMANVSISGTELLVGNDGTALVDDHSTSIDIGDSFGFDVCDVLVSSIIARLTYSDVPPLLPPPPVSPPPASPYVTIVESDNEVFSCGSLGECGSPVGRIIGKVTVTNPDLVAATVNFIVAEGLILRISDVSNNPYSVSQSIGASQSITFFIYGWVGSVEDPFPVDPLDGEIIISLIYSGGVVRESLTWFYLGL